MAVRANSNKRERTVYNVYRRCLKTNGFPRALECLRSPTVTVIVVSIVTISSYLHLAQHVRVVAPERQSFTRKKSRLLFFPLNRYLLCSICFSEPLPLSFRVRQYCEFVQKPINDFDSYHTICYVYLFTIIVIRRYYKFELSWRHFFSLYHRFKNFSTRRNDNLGIYN